MLRYLLLAFATIMACSLIGPVPALQAGDAIKLHDDALYAPPPRHASRAAGAETNLYTPSAYLAGSIAVRLVLPESTAASQQENWTPAEIARLEQATQAAFAWWAARVPQARVSFQIRTQVVPIQGEPITHGLIDEHRWIGAALAELGFDGSDHFEQAYSANAALRRELATDWATTLFVANSAADSDNSFADGGFAYAYVNGPFAVLTSEVGGYGAPKFAHILTHELGHIFGALDQYAAAGTPCTATSGYLAVATTNSQANNCGTHQHSIMWEPVHAFEHGLIDNGALGQVGYRDSDGDATPDPLDTEPTLNVAIVAQQNGRPQVFAQAVDRAFTALHQRSVTINPIDLIEFRTNAGEWLVLPPSDGSYNSSEERVDSTLALYDGTHTVELRAVNRVGGVSPVVSQTLTVSGVGSAPMYQLDIPRNISAPTFALQLDLPPTLELRSSHSAGMTTSAWQPTLLPVRGQVNGSQTTLFLQLRDQSGLETPIHRRTINVASLPTRNAPIHVFIPLATR